MRPDLTAVVNDFLGWEPLPDRLHLIVTRDFLTPQDHEGQDDTVPDLGLKMYQSEALLNDPSPCVTLTVGAYS